jgi:hypothetical protein
MWLTPSCSSWAKSGGPVRTTLRAEAERRGQGDGDTALTKLCCVQLFNAGVLDDVLLIWQAKEASWDAHNAIDVQLLGGAGLKETKAYLGDQRPTWRPTGLRMHRGRWRTCSPARRR